MPASRPDVPAIVFDDVSYTAPGGTRVFARFSMHIEAGEVVALVGRSGAGKTTLLRLVNRMAVPAAGRVVVDGRDTCEWDPIRLRRSTGYVIQDVGLFPHMTVAGNIAVVPALEGWSADRQASRVRELLDLVGLDPAVHAARWPDQLSGGQRQRVGVARALAADPRILLMDEPFGALDPVTRADLQSEFRRIQDRLKKTVIIVTHDMGEALSLADRIAVLDDGRLAALATPEEIVGSREPIVRRLLDAVGARRAT
jgi:osmoprotectant transport system ATP-binding protein